MSTITIFLSNPLTSFAYLLLITSLIGCWFCPKYYIFAPIYVIAYACAFAGGVVTAVSLLPLCVIILCLLSLKLSPKRFLHFFATMIVAVVGVGMMAHMVKGFDNLLVLNAVTFGDSKIPINMYLNFDKASLGVLLIGLYIPLIQEREKWKHVIYISIPWIAFSVLILFLFSKTVDLINIDIKLPRQILYFIIINFFFVVIPEEAFFRGFLQNEIVKGLSNRAAPILGILSVSLLFGFIHFFFVPNIYYIFGVMIASVLYGTIYHFSESIESSIITHFSVNIIHFIFFTYPFL
jgi:membrane protease YdiL (CAAX protease family)